MNDAAVSNSSPNPARESSPDDPDDPGARQYRPAVRGIRGWRPSCLYFLYSQISV
jgi:hypothetical protein